MSFLTNYESVCKFHPEAITALTRVKNAHTSPLAFAPLKDFKFEYQFEPNHKYGIAYLLWAFDCPYPGLNDHRGTRQQEMGETEFKHCLLSFTKVSIVATNGKLIFTYALDNVKFAEMTPRIEDWLDWSWRTYSKKIVREKRERLERSFLYRLRNLFNPKAYKGLTNG